MDAVMGIPLHLAQMDNNFNLILLEIMPKSVLMKTANQFTNMKHVIYTCLLYILVCTTCCLIRCDAKKKTVNQNMLLLKKSTIFTQSLQNSVKMRYVLKSTSKVPHFD